MAFDFSGMTYQNNYKYWEYSTSDTKATVKSMSYFQPLNKGFLELGSLLVVRASDGDIVYAIGTYNSGDLSKDPVVET